MKTIINIETQNEFVKTYTWLLHRIKEVEFLNQKQGMGANPEKYLGQNYLNALYDVKKMFCTEDPLLKLLV